VTATAEECLPWGIRYYHFDELGSTRLLTDANGTVTDRYAYDAYGALISHDRYTGSVSQPYQYVGRLGYYTHWMEPEFGLLQLGVRFYDAQVGRFGQRDPAKQGLSLYSYTDGAPLVSVDPSGLVCTPISGWYVVPGISARTTVRIERKRTWELSDWHTAGGGLISCEFRS